jgi:hypothetical protein
MMRSLWKLAVWIAKSLTGIGAVLGFVSWKLPVWVWRLLATLAPIGLIISVVSISLAVSSSFSVTPTPPLDPADILSTPFIVSNTGKLRTKMMQFTCSFNSVSLGDEASGRWSRGQNLVSVDTKQFNIPTLNPTQQTIIYCSVPMQASILLGFVKSADLIITIGYRVVLLPRNFQQSFRFTTTEDHQGNLRWLPKAN